MKVQDIPIDKLVISDLNIRIGHDYGDEEDKELEENMESLGLLQPLVVRRKGDFYEILIGRRRFMSMKNKGATEVTCIVKELSDNEAIDASISENVFRKKVDPVTLGAWIKKRLKQGNIGLNEYARRIGKSKSTLSEWLRMNDLTEEMKEEVQRGGVPFNYALKVARMELDPSEEFNLVTASREGGLESFKKAVDDLSAIREKRGSPRGLKIIRINFGRESREHAALIELAEAKGLKLGEYCLEVLREHVRSSNT